MKKEFWLEKWQNNQIGFHKDFVHPLLMKYKNQLNINKGDTVFVPLCGKSLDMLWLKHQGYNVIGVELSEIAIQQFISENQLNYRKTKKNALNCYEMDGIRIYQADLFDLQAKHLNEVCAIYDRAALIALPAEMVTYYVQHIKSVCSKDIQWLLIVLEYDKESGPPFSQSNERIEMLFANFSQLEMIREEDILAREPKFQKDGCNYLYERTYLIST